MKKRITALTLLLALMMVLGSVSNVFAVSKPYGYTITVYSGNHGHFKDGSTVKKIKVEPGERVNISYPVVLNDNEEDSQYYVRGYRETGHDNDEKMTAPSFDADEDASFEVAYGMKGGMVKYTVKYVDANGKELASPEEFYGMVGDKPVVSYHYFDGYSPNAYNITKTLKADESENVFEFSYTVSTRQRTADNTGNDDQAGANNAGGQNNAGGASNAGGQNNADANANADNNANANAGADENGNTPAQLTDLDDNAVPQADSPDAASDNADSDSSKAGINSAAIIGAIAAVAAIAALVAFFIKRRSEYEEDEEEE